MDLVKHRTALTVVAVGLFGVGLGLMAAPALLRPDPPLEATDRPETARVKIRLVTPPKAFVATAADRLDVGLSRVAADLGALAPAPRRERPPIVVTTSGPTPPVVRRSWYEPAPDPEIDEDAPPPDDFVRARQARDRWERERWARERRLAADRARWERDRLAEEERYEQAQASWERDRWGDWREPAYAPPPERW